MSKTDHLIYAAKEILRDALEHSGATILSHGFAENKADVSFATHNKIFCLTVMLTEVSADETHTKSSPLPPARARRALARGETR
jgi:hypothetical protein